MPTTGSLLVRAVVPVVLCVGLTACTDEADPTESTSATASPSRSGSATLGTDEDPVCAALTAEELTALAGRPVPAASSTGQDGVAECDTTSDDLAVVMFWQVRPQPGSLDQEVDESGSTGLDRWEVSVAGQDAALLVGEQGGQRVARVVTVVGDRSLLVGVAYFEVMGETEATPETLRALALGIAEQAAAAMG